MTEIRRKYEDLLEQRLAEPNPLIQVILGPRQVGKSTSAKRVNDVLGPKSLYLTADDIAPIDARRWLEEGWQNALEVGHKTVLLIDEVQKLENWSETVKRLWDGTSLDRRPKLVLLGSSLVNSTWFARISCGTI